MGLSHILVVDDEPLNLILIEEYLEGLDVRLSFAKNGREAWDLLTAEPDGFDVVLLDRMMPKMTGMEVMERMSGHPVLKNCPVIMQTAMASQSEKSAGIKAGAYYYLTKPFDGATLISIVKSALDDLQKYKSLQTELADRTETIRNIRQATFKFGTLQEAHDLALMIAGFCSSSPKILMGLSEILINAVEHGNLEIGYDEKTVLNNEGRWEQEIENRLQQDKYKYKEATLTFSSDETGYHITIRDDGQGFVWGDYLTISPKRVTDNHGRGIAMAVGLGFNKIEYHGCGNEVYLFIAR